jgi:hypothetical protein
MRGIVLRGMENALREVLPAFLHEHEEAGTRWQGEADVDTGTLAGLLSMVSMPDNEAARLRMLRKPNPRRSPLLVNPLPSSRKKIIQHRPQRQRKEQCRLGSRVELHSRWPPARSAATHSRLWLAGDIPCLLEARRPSPRSSNIVEAQSFKAERTSFSAFIASAVVSVFRRASLWLCRTRVRATSTCWSSRGASVGMLLRMACN